MLDFSKARPGDALWSDIFGKVTFKTTAGTQVFCCDSGGVTRDWKKDGKYESWHAVNDLHWSRPVFEEPPPPKRMRKVRIEREAHFVRSVGRDGFTVHLSYANSCWCPVDCIHHQPVVFEFEVGE